jgi:hypothetical protein
MASSIKALAASLENVAARLRRLQAGTRSDETVVEMLEDLEDDEEIGEPSKEPAAQANSATVAAELARIEDFVARARLLPNDAKARSFQEAIKVILDLGRQGRGSGKAAGSGASSRKPFIPRFAPETTKSTSSNSSILT